MITLKYLELGQRDYASHRNYLYGRRHWEFQAVIDGDLALRLRNNTLPFQSSIMWCIPPTTEHAWHGKTETPCNVIVFHFPDVPEALQNAIHQQPYLTTELTEDDKHRLTQLGKAAKAYLKQGSAHSLLFYQQLLCELSLLCLRDQKPQKLGSLWGKEHLVEKAKAWYLENMHEGPGLDDIAAVMSISTSHMRRLFHECLEMSPSQAFDQLRVTRAIELMQNENATLENIAYACGYGSASAFTRAFKRLHGYTPKSWRKFRSNEQCINLRS